MCAIRIDSSTTAVRQMRQIDFLYGLAEFMIGALCILPVRSITITLTPRKQREATCHDDHHHFVWLCAHAIGVAKTVDKLLVVQQARLLAAEIADAS